MLYNVICSTAILLFRVLYRWDVRGRDNLPVDGPVIICSNHISWWDPLLVGSVVWPRKVHYMAKAELFKLPVFSFVLPRIHVFPVRRGAADRKAIRTALDVVKNGQLLGLFPEGTRSRTGDLLPPQPGVGLITQKSSAPVLPIAIVGPYRLFRPLRVIVGKPLDFSGYQGKKARAEVLDEIANTIMKEIGTLKDSS
jgi:1-acyl-sn-glycerol-3-phosphate acyltransferase